MTGLFRRLARQVVGPEPTKAHAMARLPFLAPPEMVAAEETSLPESQIRAPTPTAPLDAYVQGEAPASPAVRTPQATAIPRDAQMPDAPRERQKGAARRRSAAPAEDPRVRPPLLSEPRHRGRAHSRAGDTAMPVPAVSEAVPAPIAETPVVSVPPPIVTQPVAADEERGWRPAHRVTAAAPGSRQMRQPVGTASAPADEPAEVHVHIGRIEVTAVQEPDRRRKPPTGPQPMSLNEYLKRRQRGRP